VFKTTGADRVAVEGLNLTLYEGQITVLLGHNGYDNHPTGPFSSFMWKLGPSQSL
jgi:energy-coupling factor transporter ATP-binding protein EcfA2